MAQIRTPYALPRRPDVSYGQLGARSSGATATGLFPVRMLSTPAVLVFAAIGVFAAARLLLEVL